MPRQLRGPFEKVTNQFSKSLDSGWSHRSGRKSRGRSKTSSDKLTKRGLWLTTVCLIESDMDQSGMHGTRTPPGILTPEIMAPDGGTTRGRPAGVATERRSVSLMTAVCSKELKRELLSQHKYVLARKGSFSSSSYLGGWSRAGHAARNSSTSLCFA
jgi:hypothetical protein